MVKKLPAYMTEILLEKDVKWNKQTKKKQTNKVSLIKASSNAGLLIYCTGLIYSPTYIFKCKLLLQFRQIVSISTKSYLYYKF
jgi:hypothetical protein